MSPTSLQVATGLVKSRFIKLGLAGASSSGIAVFFLGFGPIPRDPAPSCVSSRGTLAALSLRVSAGQKSYAVTMAGRIVAEGLALNQGAPYFRYSSKNAFSFSNGMTST